MNLKRTSILPPVNLLYLFLTPAQPAIMNHGLGNHGFNYRPLGNDQQDCWSQRCCQERFIGKTCGRNRLIARLGVHQRKHEGKNVFICHLGSVGGQNSKGKMIRGNRTKNLRLENTTQRGCPRGSPRGLPKTSERNIGNEN